MTQWPAMIWPRPTAYPSAMARRLPCEPSAKPTVIDLFGDTGHHFAFVPLTSRQLSDNPVSKSSAGKSFPVVRGPRLKRRVAALAPLSVCATRGRGHAHRSEGLAWAIQTNEGTAYRGWALQPEEAVPSTDAAHYTAADKTRTPYASPFDEAARRRRATADGIPAAYTGAGPRLLRARPLLSLDLEIHWLEPVGKVVTWT